MKYQRTQIYLDPEEHRSLVREAAERGLSLTEYLRRIIGDRAAEQVAPYDAASWEGLFALGNSGPKDTVEYMDQEVAKAFEAEHQRSLRRSVAQPAPKSKKTR